MNKTKIPILEDKPIEIRQKYYEEMIPFLMIKNYPIFKYADLLGLDKDDKKVLSNIRKCLFEIFTELKESLSYEDYVLIHKNIRTIKKYFPHINFENVNVGMIDSKTKKTIMKEATENQKKAALIHMYKNDDYLCDNLFKKTLCDIIFRNELDVDQILMESENLNNKDFQTIEKRLNMSTFLVPIPILDYRSSHDTRSEEEKKIANILSAMAADNMYKEMKRRR